jgi:hypothetical protein
MSKWMKAYFPWYDPEKAPPVLMPKSRQNATRCVYNKWRAEMRQKMGGAFDWGRVRESDMRTLSDKMFDAAGVLDQI